MGKKNSGHNGYYYFMLEFKKKHGHTSMDALAEAASPHWARLNKEQRQYYDNMARSNKQCQKKQTSLGELIDSVTHEKNENDIRDLNMKTDIENIVSRAVRNGTIADQYFYVMHVNDFCSCAGRFYPAEIAVGKFSLRDGINASEVCHSIVNPGPLPMGYSNTARLHSEETHQLPPPGPDDEDNMEEVFTSIISFLTDNTNEATPYPTIYVDEKLIKMVENVMNFFSESFGHSVFFKIYRLQYLFFVLRNSISKSADKIWPSISVSILELDKDVYDFCKGIACDFHENTDTPVHCSRSRVIRATYIICDNCIKDLDIEPILGQHVPYNAAAAAAYRRPSSSSSSRASVRSTTLFQSQSLYETPAGSYMPSRSESRMSSVSEQSTVVDDSDGTLSQGFYTDSQVDDDTDEWQKPRVRGRQRQLASAASSQKQSVTDDFKSLSMSQNSTDSDYAPIRRPVTMSGVVQPPVSTVGTRGLVAARGRGRGIVNKTSDN